MKETTKPRRRTGRPLGFDRDEALHQAMLLFWRHGYDATPLSQLTAAMGISPPSLYAAFGDKKQLFMEAVRRYSELRLTGMGVIESAATARDAVWALLESAAAGFTGCDTPAGCLIVSGAANCAAGSGDVAEALAGIRTGIEERLASRIRRDVDDGLLPRGVDAGALAGMYMAVFQGMSNQARDGADRDKLLAVARTAMNAWPADPRP